jgi:predicted SnoaL-like aldol condensation-catalyzing enzyme
MLARNPMLPSPQLKSSVIQIRRYGCDRSDFERKTTMKLSLGLTMLLSLFLVGPALAEHPYSAEELKNKEIVLDFYQKALNEKDFAGASKYLGTYIQHSPAGADGPETLHKYVDFLKKNFPNSKSQIVRVVVDGDIVILHVHSVHVPGERGNAVFDMFRVKNGKIEEHWDCIQPVPESSANTNTMF